MPEAYRRGKAYKERSGSGDPRIRGFQFHDHPWVNINIEDTESLMEKKNSQSTEMMPSQWEVGTTVQKTISFQQ